MRDPGGEPALGRLRRARRAAAAEARTDPRLHVGHRQAGRGASQRRRDRLLRPQLQQPRRHADRACRSVADRAPCRPSLRLRGLGDRLPDAVDRAERALRRPDADPVDGDHSAVPREHARTRAPAEGARGDPRRHDRESAVHRRRGGAMVARPGGRRDSDSPGLLHLAERAAAARARAGTGEPLDAERHARPRPQVHLDWDSREPRRARAPVSVGSRDGWPRRPATAVEVARDRQARGARGSAGHRRVEDAFDLVVGMGDLQPGRHRPRQERGRLRLPLGTRPTALQRPGCRRAPVRRVADGRAAQPARRRHLHAADRRDPGERRDAARAGDRRPRYRHQRRPRTARAPERGRARCASGARRRARLRGRPLQRQPQRLSGCAAADQALENRCSWPAARRAAPRRGARALPADESVGGGDRRVSPHLCRLARAPRRDGEAGRLARLPQPRARGRDVRSRQDLLAAARSVVFARCTGRSR